MTRTFWKIWLVPLLLGVSSMIGLISALTGDGLWDALSWLTLGVVPLVIVRALLGVRKLPPAGNKPDR